MDGELRRFADAVTMPWLGGGGITHELARHPADGDFGWRLSIAEVQEDGPFSRLPGVDRVIVLCSVGRMMLQAPDPQELQRFSPYAFDGGAEVSCMVPDGPTLDFNVMTRRGAYDADVSCGVGNSIEADVPEGSEVFVVCLDGSMSVGDVALREFDLTRLDGPAALDAKHGAAAIVQITPTPRVA